MIKGTSSHQIERGGGRKEWLKNLCLLARSREK